MKIKDVTGVVLAGGNSSRMGIDKASLIIDGKKMISYVIDALKEVFSDIIVVTKDANDIPISGVKTIADSISGCGPLVGIYSALSSCDTPYCFVIACDMPCVDPDLVRWMVNCGGDYDAFVPKLGGFFEPLFALYSNKCLDPIKQNLARGDYRVRSVFSKVNVGYADESDLRIIDPQLRSFVNINTREDLRLLGDENTAL